MIAAIGAFAGSGVAFYWNARREDHKHKAEMVDNINKALLVLFHQYNTLVRMVSAIDEYICPELRFSHKRDYRIRECIDTEVLISTFSSMELVFLAKLDTNQKDIERDINSTIDERNHHYEKEIFPCKTSGFIDLHAYQEASQWISALRDKAIGRSKEIFEYSRGLHERATRHYPEGVFLYVERNTSFDVVCNDLDLQKKVTFTIDYVDTPKNDQAATEILKKMPKHSITPYAVNENTSSFLENVFRYKIESIEAKDPRQLS